MKNLQLLFLILPIMANSALNSQVTITSDTTLHVVGKFKYQDGTQQPGFVLTSDANGTTSWQEVGSTIWGKTPSHSIFNLNGSHTISGANSLVLGDLNNVTGDFSLVMGQENDLVSDASVVFGLKNRAQSSSVFIFGSRDTIVGAGSVSFAFGQLNFLNANLSGAFGSNNRILTSYTNSFAIGRDNIIHGSEASTFGTGLNTPSLHEIALGTYNELYTPNSSFSWQADDRIFTVGNGQLGARSNALTILKNGNTGVGVSDPLNKLDVDGGIVVGNAFAGVHLAPANGALFEGSVSIGTANTAGTLSILSTSGTKETPVIKVRSTHTGIGGKGVMSFFDENDQLKGWVGINTADGMMGGNGALQLMVPPGGRILLASNNGEPELSVFNNNVGIGTYQPQNKLDVDGALAVGLLYGGDEVAPADGAIIQGSVGIGTIMPQNKLDVEGALAIGQTYSGNVAAPANGAIIQGTVGIGTSNPTKGQLEVEGTGITQTLTFAYLDWNNGIVAGDGTFDRDYSIWASGNIAATEFHAISDQRVKNIIGTSDSRNDLHTLMSIQVTDYTMRDTISNGATSIKKVVAQQVKEVYPQAVKNNITEVVPDIFQRAMIKDGWIILTTDLTPGERVKIITEQASDVYEVLETEPHRFRVRELPTEDCGLKTVFVYGREVSDFHTVDYEAIAMLNVSATQELARLVRDQQKTIDMLTKRLNEIELADTSMH